jgi:hypothetical protein
MLPIRFGVSAAARFDAGTGEQPLFENLVGPISRQWPADPSHPRSLEIVLDRAARRPSVRPISRVLTPSWWSRNICRSCRMVSSLLAGIKAPPR